MPILQIAIVGSGPAGCYLAERLVREAPGCRIDIIDRLPTPYGLVRAGVAPDHQSTKAISRIFDRVLTRDGVAFWGNVEIGVDITLDELRRLYDAVIIATGAPQDRRLGVPGEDLPGIIGSAAFVGWYNSHPDYPAAAPDLSAVRSAVIIGNGNVALDVARILAKTPAELALSDIAPEIGAALAAMPLDTIHIVGRRGAEHAGFAPHELGELGALARAQPVVAAADLPPGESAPNPAVIAQLRDFARSDATAKPLAIRFHFHAAPAGFSGADHVETARFVRPDGGALALRADLVVTCIGYRSVPCCTLIPEDGVFANTEGRIAPGLYVVGWAKRGPSGTIATNRAEAHEIARRVATEISPAGREGGEALAAHLTASGVRRVDYAAWLRIDAAERARAETGRPRRKFASRADLLAGVS
ncbi:MAG TPA: FAD-dependent oxidoreductase [Stellaceae bacterium]|nr:FAD-dependent oxidoreductase [Stellaceae bacterium]